MSRTKLAWAMPWREKVGYNPTFYSANRRILYEEKGIECLHIDTSDIRKMTVHTDESVRQEILWLSKCQSIAEFQRKDIGERKEICRIMKEREAGVRQLSRITGVSLGTLSKC